MECSGNTKESKEIEITPLERAMRKVFEEQMRFHPEIYNRNGEDY